MNAEIMIVLLACAGTTGLLALVALKSLEVIAQLMVMLKAESPQQVVEYKEAVKAPEEVPPEFFIPGEPPGEVMVDVNGNEYRAEDLVAMS